MTNGNEDWLLWQLSDSALPTGGFVASSGLESAAQAGHVTDIASLSLFVAGSIENYAHSALPFVSDAWKIVESAGGSSPRGSSAVDEDAKEGSPSDDDAFSAVLRRTLDLDDLYEACTSNTVAKRASRAQGVAMLTLYAKSFDKENVGDGGLRLGRVVDAFKLEVRREMAHAHYPICFGLVARCVGLGLDRTQHLFLFLFARAILSAAVRLNLVGPYYAQRMLSESRTSVERALVKTVHLNADDAAQTSPLLDILQGRHDRLYSKLFNS